MPDAAFPNMIVGTKSKNRWPYLRSEISHNWYVDKRNPTVGFVSRDEAAILYNIALLFHGLPCLEIGCWRGWSTVHLALGCGNLEVIDPVMRDIAFRDDLTETFRRAGVLECLALHDGWSPEEIERISVDTGKRWSLSFIDGDHEGDAPRRDAEMVARFAAKDAAILLHDLASPYPAAALEYLRSQGWETWVYQTMQIMGVAVRGTVRPIEHVPDPTQSWTLPTHLMRFPVIGEHRSARLHRVLGLSGGKVPDPQIQDADGIDDLSGNVASLIDTLLTQIGDLSCRIYSGREDAQAASAFGELQRKYMDLLQKLSDAKRERDEIASDRTALGERVAGLQLQRDELERERDEIASDRTALGERVAGLQLQRDELERERDEIASERKAFDLLQEKHVTQTEKLAHLQIERDGLVQREKQLVAELAEASHEREAFWRRLEHSIRKVAELEREGTDLKRANAELLQVPGSPPPLPGLTLEPVDEQAIHRFSLWMARHRILFGLSRRVMAGRKLEVRLLVERSLRDHGISDPATAMIVDWLSAPRVVLGLARRRICAGMGAVQGLVVLEIQRRIEASGLMLVSSAAPRSMTAELQRSLDVGAHRFRNLKQQFRALQQQFRALEAAKLSDEKALLAARIANAKLLGPVV
jgi:hypothetical protein